MIELPDTLFVRCINLEIVQKNITRLWDVTVGVTAQLNRLHARRSTLESLIAQDLVTVVNSLNQLYPGKIFDAETIYTHAQPVQGRQVEGYDKQVVIDTVSYIFLNKIGKSPGYVTGVVVAYEGTKPLGFMSHPGKVDLR